MRKREFLRRLSDELSHLDRDERNDILDYYDELIEDRIEKTGKSEADVIYDLGEIEDIARRVDPSHRRKMRYEEEEEPSRVEKKSSKSRNKDKGSGAKTGIGVVLLICLFPVWIFLFALLFGLILAIVGTGVGFFAGGIVCIWNGCGYFSSSWAQGLFRIGIGICTIGVVLIIGPLLLKIITWIGHLIMGIFKWLFGGRRSAYEG